MAGLSKPIARWTLLASVPGLLLLSACGGGEDDTVAIFPASLPEFSNQMTSFAAAGESFPLNVVLVFSDETTRSVVGPNTNFTLILAADGSGDLSRGTNTYVFDSATGIYRTEGSDPTSARLALSRDVGLILFGGGQNGNGLVALGIFGRESTDVGVQGGKAIYMGPSAYLAVDNGTGAVTGGGGGFLLTADFDRAAVDGRIALSDASNPSGQFFLDISGAPISGNGFATTSLQASGLNGTVTGSALEATFYGAGAGQVGGVYKVDVSAGGGTAQLAGVLIGDRQGIDLDALVTALQNGQAAIAVGGERIVLGSGTVVGGSGSVYPGGASSFYNATTGASFGADGGGCLFAGDWSNC
jgi:hypothetical protein